MEQKNKAAAQPAAQPAAAPAPASNTNGMAVASLVLGIVSLLTSWLWFMGLVPILGIVFGVLGMKKEEGKGMAIAGLIISIIAIVIMLIFFVFFMILLIAGSASSA
jgi:glycerol-3-phosphate acyltransferase PlsY